LGPWNSASGAFSIDDVYDFDIKEEVVRQAFDSLMRKKPNTTQEFQGRSNISEIKTYIMSRLGSKLPHKDFHVVITGTFRETSSDKQAAIVPRP